MRILITGGAGFIGSNLIDFHLQKNDEVVIIDNLITGSKTNIEPFLHNKKFTFFENDLITFNFSLLTSNLFDIVYHLASPASPKQYKKYPLETLLVNSNGVYRLLEFVGKNRIGTLVLASTSEVYGDPQIHPQVESYWGNVNPVGPRSCYDEGKRFAEALAMVYFHKYNLNLRIARIFNTFGPNMEKDDGRIISNFVMQALTKQPITVYGDGKQTRSFCYISDMVNALFALGSTANIAGEIINVGNPEEFTIQELATIVKQTTGSASEIIHQPIDEDDPKRRKPDIAKANKLLNWKPEVSFQKGLEKTIIYFKNRFV